MSSRIAIVRSTGSFSDNISKLKKALAEADAVVIGAGAGLSTSAGFVYSGERFERYFPDFGKKYGFSDMYSGGFHVLELPPEELWAYWSRYIWVNRYMDTPKPLYQKLLGIVKDKDYFVLTTNVDHCFQKAASTRTGCSTPRATTACGSAASLATTRPTTTKRPCGRWWSRRALL